MPLSSNWRALLRALLWALKICGIGAAVTATIILLLFATDHLPEERMQANLMASFHEGSLQDSDWLLDNRSIGMNQYNDCLLVMMVRFRTDAWSSAVAPAVIFNDYPREIIDGAGNRLTECIIARRAVFTEHPREIFEAELYFDYGRYVHAYRVPFNLAITLGPLSMLRMIYRVAGAALLISLLALHGVRGSSALRSSGLHAAATPLSFATISAALLFFYGLDLFGPSFTHGPADLLLFIVLAWLSLRQSGPGAGDWDVAAAALGALAFAFDFLHGTVPMMFALVLGSAALRSFDAEIPARFRAVTRLVLAFGLGTAAAVATKLLLLFASIGPDGPHAFLHQLAYRISGGDHSLADVILALKTSAHLIGWGYYTPVLLALIFSFFCALCALMRLMFRGVAPPDRVPLATGLASVAVVFLWYMIFVNHTAVHAGFMVRLLAWPIGMGPGCLILALASGQQASKARSSRAERAATESQSTS